MANDKKSVFPQWLPPINTKEDRELICKILDNYYPEVSESKEISKQKSVRSW